MRRGTVTVTRARARAHDRGAMDPSSIILKFLAVLVLVGINAYFVRNDMASHIPACLPAEAFRTLEKHDVLRAAGEDVFAYAAAHGLPLVDVA